MSPPLFDRGHKQQKESMTNIKQLTDQGEVLAVIETIEEKSDAIEAKLLEVLSILED
jgi:hypothetical protein